MYFNDIIASDGFRAWEEMRRGTGKPLSPDTPAQLAYKMKVSDDAKAKKTRVLAYLNSIGQFVLIDAKRIAIELKDYSDIGELCVGGSMYYGRFVQIPLTWDNDYRLSFAYRFNDEAPDALWLLQSDFICRIEAREKMLASAYKHFHDLYAEETKGFGSRDLKAFRDKAARALLDCQFDKPAEALKVIRQYLIAIASSQGEFISSFKFVEQTPLTKIHRLDSKTIIDACL